MWFDEKLLLLRILKAKVEKHIPGNIFFEGRGVQSWEMVGKPGPNALKCCFCGHVGLCMTYTARRFNFFALKVV